MMLRPSCTSPASDERRNPKKPIELTDDLRPGLRKQAAWTICFRSWLESVQPSEAREWLQGPEEELLRHLDNLTWLVLRVVLATEQEPADWALALRQNIPEWEESATEEEIAAEDAHPLNAEEQKRLEQIADNAGED